MVHHRPHQGVEAQPDAPQEAQLARVALEPAVGVLLDSQRPLSAGVGRAVGVGRGEPFVAVDGLVFGLASALLLPLRSTHQLGRPVWWIRLAFFGSDSSHLMIQ